MNSGQFPTNSNGIVTSDPPFKHIIDGVHRDLKFLNIFGLLTNSDYESIIKKLPTSFEPHAAPHTPPGPSPISSPLTEPHILPGTSSKENSKNSSPKIISQAPREFQEVHQLPQQSQISPSQSSPHLSSYQQPSVSSPTHNHQNLSDTQVNNIGASTYEHSPRVLPQIPGATNPPQPIEPPIVNPKQEEAERYKEQEPEFLPRYSNSNELLVAQWDFGGDDEGDLNFKKGDIIEVVDHVNDEWWSGRVQGRTETGIFPKVYTVSMTIETTPMNNVSQQVASSHQHVTPQVQSQQFTALHNPQGYQQMQSGYY